MSVALIISALLLRMHSWG